MLLMIGAVLSVSVLRDQASLPCWPRELVCIVPFAVGRLLLTSFDSPRPPGRGGKGLEWKT